MNLIVLNVLELIALIVFLVKSFGEVRIVEFDDGLFLQVPAREDLKGLTLRRGDHVVEQLVKYSCTF